MQETDSHIIGLLRKDDERGLKEIFRLYFSHLLSFANEYVRDREIAREIVHDAIFRFWQHRHRLNEDTYIRAYLLKIVRNLSLNYLVKIKNSRGLIINSEEAQKDLDLNYEILADTSWDDLLVKELEEIIDKTIAGLPEKCRQVFELSRYGHLSNIEIAKQLNISVKTVEGNITEALKTIRRRLVKYLHVIIFLFFS